MKYRVTIERLEDDEAYSVTRESVELAWAIAYAIQSSLEPRATDELLAAVTCNIHECNDGLPTGPVGESDYADMMGAFVQAAIRIRDAWEVHDSNMRQDVDKIRGKA